MSETYPPGSGRDALEFGKEFFVSLLGTKDVATVNNRDVYFKTFAGDDSQKFLCVKDSNNHLCLQSKSTGGYLSRNDSGNISAYVKSPGATERFHASQHSKGGFRLAHTIEDVVNHLETAVDSVGTYIKVGVDKAAQFGFHLVDNSLAPFRRFAWVIPDVLARSSAPYYISEDADQRIDQTAIQFLVDNGVKSIISLNEFGLADDVVGMLVSRGIAYLHSPIGDFGAPSLDQLQTIHNYFLTQKQLGKASLVYCGYGHGRTGTIVSALQMYDDRNFANRSAYRDKHVETSSQMDALDQLKQWLKG